MQRLRQLLFHPTIGRHYSENPRSRWKSTGTQIAGQSWQTLWRRVLSFPGGPNLLTRKREGMLSVNAGKTLKQDATGKGKSMQSYRTTLAQHLGIQAKPRDQIFPRFWRLLHFHSRLLDFLPLQLPNTHRCHTMTETMCQRKRTIFQLCKNLIMSRKSIVTPKFLWDLSSISIRMLSGATLGTSAMMQLLPILKGRTFYEL